MEDKLYEPEVLMRMGELKGLNMPNTMVAEKLNTEFEMNITANSVTTAYNKFVNKTSEIIAGDEKVKQQLIEPILNTADQLKKINDITWRMMDNIEIEDTIKLKAIKEIRGQLDLQEKILTRMTEALNPTKISKIEYIKVSVNNLKELEKQGLITINRKMDEPIDIEEMNKDKEVPTPKRKAAMFEKEVIEPEVVEEKEPEKEIIEEPIKKENVKVTSVEDSGW